MSSVVQALLMEHSAQGAGSEALQVSQAAVVAAAAEAGEWQQGNRRHQRSSGKRAALGKGSSAAQHRPLCPATSLWSAQFAQRHSPLPKPPRFPSCYHLSSPALQARWQGMEALPPHRAAAPPDPLPVAAPHPQEQQPWEAGQEGHPRPQPLHPTLAQMHCH